MHLTTKISKPDNLHQTVYIKHKGDQKNPYTNNSKTLWGRKETDQWVMNKKQRKKMPKLKKKYIGYEGKHSKTKEFFSINTLYYGNVIRNFHLKKRKWKDLKRNHPGLNKINVQSDIMKHNNQF